MELLWMILPVFLVFAEAKNVTEVKVKLGQNVTLNCSVNISDMYWYMEIHSQFKVAILRTFGKTDDNPTYCFPEFKTKYSVLENSLVITNVTEEDCRFYFCARKKNDRINFTDTIHLISEVTITPFTNNKQHIQRIWQSVPVIFASFALNAFFLLVLFLIGLCFIHLYLKRKNSKNQVKEPSPLTSENPGKVETTPQYEEIELRVPPPTALPDCIYYKVQLPQSTPGY